LQDERVLDHFLPPPVLLGRFVPIAVDPDYEVGDGGAHFLTAPQYRPNLVRRMRFLEELPALPGTYRL
jgi:hypothetical protein